MSDAQVGNTAGTTRPRRFWQGVVFAIALLFLFSGVMIATGRVALDSVGLVLGGIDLLALVALAGHAWRRPLRGAGLQVLVLLLAVIEFVRAAIVVIGVSPNLMPWNGDQHAWQALWIIATVPLLVLLGVGLYGYATDRSHAT